MNTNEPLISIVIPVYNREKYIAETLESAIEQSYKNIEIIVVDNFSEDNTWNIIQDFSNIDNRIKSFRNNSNIGPVKNWQRCINEANGVYGKILWSDDLLDPYYLEKTVKMFNDEVGFVFSAVNIFKDDKNEVRTLYNIGGSGIYPSEDFILGDLLHRNYPVSPGCAIFRLQDLKKNLLVNIPNKVGIDFSMNAIGNDLLIFLLTAYNYKYFAYVSEPLAFFRAHNESITVSSKKGKLPLYYNMARSYFCENYRPDLIKILNVDLLFRVIQFNYLNKYPIRSISHYYVDNNIYSLHYGELLRKLTQVCLKKIKLILKGILGFMELK